MFIPWAVTLLLLVHAPDGGSGKARINNRGVWLESKAGRQQHTLEGTAKRLLFPSPDGRRQVYVIDHESSCPDYQPPTEEVIETDTAGNVLRQIVPEGCVPVPIGPDPADM